MSETASLSVTVIIPTKNRAQDLERTIESLLAQTHQPTEIVIVDQSNEKSFTKAVPIPVRCIHDAYVTGTSDARNAGMKEAKGDIWLFLDDDVVLEPDFIEELLKTYAPGVTGVSGVITNYPHPPLLQRLWESVFQRGPFHDERQRAYRNAERLRHSTPLRVRQFGGGLMSFRADEIRRLRFDTHLTGACPGEDIEFCARLPKRSVLLISPKARLAHKRSPESRDPAHWLTVHAQVSNYMRQLHWRSGVWNHLCFLWLNIGYVLAALASSLKRRSLEPWIGWRRGRRKGRKIAAGDTDSRNS